ncbi:hypothetical protein NDU88_004469 [Pleurodeles waltl]|uniref:Uncharacterized protein n=1 Tax=Pleurodeles waltl TaxID=8319 RepID=A0AAV7VK37_PLEWA|nr:hypothetical protein NDU88_004469 [Pleurodeles waltl]
MSQCSPAYPLRGILIHTGGVKVCFFRGPAILAIQECHTALEYKIETVSIDVNLLRADLRKVEDKVTTAETNITALQGEVATLKRQVAQTTTTMAELE